MQGRPRKKEKQTEVIYSRFTVKERKHLEGEMKKEKIRHIGGFVRKVALKGAGYGLVS